MVRNAIRYTGVFAALVALALTSGCRKKAYENPITKDTQQPDKVLFDTSINDIEHGRYERARLTLQTLMNTYDSSEYLAKAKLAVADSWFREGGAHGFAQAEAEYKDFILFYPQMEEAAEAQEKICKMQYNQMDKSDRDSTHARLAEDECRQLVQQFPNSKFAPAATQMLRDIQEVLADREFGVGAYYNKKGSYPASANRLQAVIDQYPLYSRSDDALWMAAEDYQRMGDNFEERQAAAFTKIVKDYPLSDHVTEATAKLKAMGRPIPQADPVAYNRMKYEIENRQKRSLISKAWGPFASHPYTANAAKSGSPQMTHLNPTVPLSIPAAAAGTGTNTVTAASTGTGGGDVTVSTVNNSTLIDTAPDARIGKPAEGGAGAAPAAATPPAAAPGTTGTAAPAGAAANGAAPAAGVSATTPSAQINPNAPLPQNHTGPVKVKKEDPNKQLKEAQKAQELAKKQAAADKKKQEEADKKKAQEEAKNKKKKPTVQPDPQTQPVAKPAGSGQTTPDKQ
jgi:outer membrane protein assembly factor BamD